MTLGSQLTRRLPHPATTSDLRGDGILLASGAVAFGFQRSKSSIQRPHPAAHELA